MAHPAGFKTIAVSKETYAYLEAERTALVKEIMADGDTDRVSLHDVIKNMIQLQEDVRLENGAKV